MSNIKTINADTLKSWLDKGEALLIDVREPAEYQNENIEGAKLIPLSTISKELIPNIEGKKLVIHCKAGRRGENACLKLLTEDPNLDIYNLEGGISSWVEAGYRTIKSSEFFLPLDRQVQLVIGTFVLIGSILGYTLDRYFFLIPCFFGAGLVFASITGRCGLAMIIAKMPWNKVTTNI